MKFKMIDREDDGILASSFLLNSENKNASV